MNDTFGIIINTSELDFGTIVQGGAVDKKIFLTNEYEFPVRVEVEIDEAFENYLYGRTNIILKSGEKIDYNVGLIIPKSAEKREYTGYIRFNFFPIK